jgi:hypothetical protein
VLDPVTVRLSIQIEGTNVFICWPLSCTEYVLQSSMVLATPTLWSDVVASAFVTHDLQCVREPLGDRVRFYALRRR